MFQKCTGLKPGQMSYNVYRQRSKHLVRSLRNKQKPDVKGRARKRKMKSSSVAASKKARLQYGAEVPNVIPDISPMQLQQRCDEFMTTHIDLTTLQCEKIQQGTKSQSFSSTWKEERRIRLTASHFGEVVRRNVSRPVKPLVEKMLYSGFRGNACTSYGVAQESSTIKEYVQYKADRNEKVVVKPMGLAIDAKHKFLAASTDGMVEDVCGNQIGLLEVNNLLQRNQITFQEAANKLGSFCLKVSGGTVSLKRSHGYYFQCQGQLNILQNPWLDFVARRNNPNQLHVERIFRDKVHWETEMIPKLKAFFFNALLPELASPRHGMSPGIREPDKPWKIKEPIASSNRTTRQTRNSKKKDEVKGHQASDLEPTPGKSSDTDPPIAVRSKRRRHTKFVGRKILHEWCVDEKCGKTSWYAGIVFDCVKGKDGDPSAEYEVAYEGEKEKYIVDSLQEDLDSGSLKFKDI